MPEFTDLVLAGVIAGWIICSFIALGGELYRAFRMFGSGLHYSEDYLMELPHNVTISMLCIVLGPLRVGYMIASATRK